jgi:hypothetical protein
MDRPGGRQRGNTRAFPRSHAERGNEDNRGWFLSCSCSSFSWTRSRARLRVRARVREKRGRLWLNSLWRGQETSPQGGGPLQPPHQVRDALRLPFLHHARQRIPERILARAGALLRNLPFPHHPAEPLPQGQRGGRRRRILPDLSETTSLAEEVAALARRPAIPALPLRPL